ncbi:class I SAM-dependent methyltransferase [Actinophytocola oryzae]|uniref:Methyltransferase family protein n=1 Tax=Actinophytocola oryzae TaxID=502181 RepID=A0A4R7USF4_9PSEU|nr:class I SAM-dependent methyltransferase [Actinophytocola oryzae]TDV38674.1 methyltransferase family protein [Actinophytocola oryzae]
MLNWTTGRLPAVVYDLGVRHEWLARPVGSLLWGTDTRELYSTIRTLAVLPAGTSVLDVPCGGGPVLRGVRRDIRYVAADISPVMLGRTRREARRRSLDVTTVEADIARLPFADNDFDVCVSFNGLHCLPEPAFAVRELARCLRPGGRLIGDTLVLGAGRRQDLAITVLRRLGLFGPGGTSDDIVRWLTDAGLRVDRLEHSGAVTRFAATR